MDTDMPFKGRFCWPAQDRVRAVHPLTAPRTSPVFTASVFPETQLPDYRTARTSPPFVQPLAGLWSSEALDRLVFLNAGGDSCSAAPGRRPHAIPACTSWGLAGREMGAARNGGDISVPDWRVVGEQDA